VDFNPSILVVLGKPLYNRTMDPVTHTLIGVGLGNAFFRKTVGPHAIPIMVIASNLPDVDALVHLTGSPEAILARRTFGHSVLILPFLAFLASLILKRFWPHENISRIYAMLLLGALVHLFFDLVNSFGVVPLWPMSPWRPEWGIIFIIDLVLTGLLALPLLLSFPKRMRPWLVPLTKGALALVFLYTLFCGINRNLALNILLEKGDQSLSSGFQYVFPEPLGPHRWRGVTRTGEMYKVFLIHSLRGEIELIETVSTNVKNPMVKQVRKTPLAQKIQWFFKAPVWEVNENRKGQTPSVRVYDLRFKSLIIERPIPFVFQFSVLSNGTVGAP